MHLSCRLRVFAVIMYILFFMFTNSSHASELDKAIESSIKDSYTFRTYLKDDTIKADSKSGVVTLRGTVADEYHKLLAIDTVSNLPCVKKVEDKLEISKDSFPRYSDDWLSIKAKTVLVFHFNLNPLTKIYVKEGIVTLQGQANSLEQKELTGRYIKDVEGVKGVKNEMTIIEPASKPQKTMIEKMDDASITAQVKLALLFYRSTNSFKTHVQTEKGTVTLTGKAKTEAEKELITKLVSDINGVKEVVNNMIVSNP